MERKSILKKNGSLKVAYRIVARKMLNDCTEKETIYHLKFWCGSRKNMTLVDTEYWHMIDLLESCGLKYSLGNDAPRGGIEGDYIKVKFDKRNHIVKECALAMSKELSSTYEREARLSDALKQLELNAR